LFPEFLYFISGLPMDWNWWARKWSAECKHYAYQNIGHRHTQSADVCWREW